MRKLGLIGGMSWISTRTYYEQINRLVQRRLGPRASPPLAIECLDYRDFADLSDPTDWQGAAGRLCDAAMRLQQAGAGAIVISANVMHKVADEVAAAIDVPLIHIGDCAARHLQACGVCKAILLGTREVMVEGFLRDRIAQAGVELLLPQAAEMEQLDRLIAGELKLGKASRSAERLLKSIITVSEQAGARAVILACTELDMVVDVDANLLPVYDTARIHCHAAVEWICAEEA